MSNTITIGGVEFRNCDRFAAWLARTVKTRDGEPYEMYPRVDLPAVSECHGVTGGNSYELFPFETISGHAEAYYFDVEYNDDGNPIYTF